MLNEDHITLKGKNGHILFTDIKELLNSDMLKKTLEFEYNKKYENYLENLKHNFTNQQIELIEKSSNPKFEYIINLSDFNFNTLHIYSIYIKHKDSIENDNIFTLFENIYEHFECICFAEYILDTKFYNYLINNIELNLTYIKEVDIVIYKLCIWILLLTKHKINFKLFPQNSYLKKLLKINSNDFYLKLEEDKYNNFIQYILKIINNYLNKNIEDMSIVRILYINNILDNKIDYKLIDIKSFFYMYKYENETREFLGITVFLDIINKTQEQCIQDFVLYCYENLIYINMNLLSYEIDLLNKQTNKKTKTLIMERINKLNDIIKTSISSHLDINCTK